MSFQVPFPNFQPNTNALSSQVNANFAAIVNFLNNSGFTGYPTVYNAASATFAGGISPGATPTQNTAALNAVILAVINAGGGIVFVPAGSYKINGPIAVTGATAGVVIQGSSTGSEIIQTVNLDMFDVSQSTQSGGNYGVRFRDINFTYSGNPTAGIAINCFNGGASTTAEYCAFINCPQAFSTGADGKALQCGLIGCTIVQQSLNNSVQVLLSAAQCYITQCIIRQTPINSGGPTGCIGVQVSGTTENYITNSHISDFTTGVFVGSGASFCYILGNAIPAYKTSIKIQPATNTGTINAIIITGNYLAATAHAVADPLSIGIYVDTNGGANTNVSDIEIANNLVTGFFNPGLNVNSGSAVTVVGGKFSSNGQSPSSTALGANIAISGGQQIRVNGSDCYATDTFTGGVQPNACLSLSGGCQDVWVMNTDLSGTTLPSVPVYNSGQGVHCYVKGCRGYNNQSTLITGGLTALPATGIHFDALGFGSPMPGTSWPTPYFGDYLVTLAGSAITNLWIAHERITGAQTATGLNGPIALRMDAGQSVAVGYNVNGVSNFEIFGQ